MQIYVDQNTFLNLKFEEKNTPDNIYKTTLFFLIMYTFLKLQITLLESMASAEL